MTKGNVKSEKGFSLVELSMLLAMTALLAALSIPMLTSSMRDMQLVSDARNIATTMTYAKLSATSQMTHYRTSFDLDGNEWKLEKWNRSSNAFELQQAINSLSNGVSNSGIAFKTNSGTAPSGFPTASSTEITFNSRGIPIGGVGIIYLSNEDEDFAVSASLSGKIQIWRYRDSQWISQ
jgi:Tfp pilus assembly protein FimT